MGLFSGLMQGASLLGGILGGQPNQGPGQAVNVGPALGPAPPQTITNSQTAALPKLGILPDEPPMEPLREKKEGFMTRTNNFLGSEAGRMGQGLIGGYVADRRMRKNTEWNHARLKRAGLTSFEIGGGASGGVVGSQGSVLGSGPITAQKQQQKFQRQENVKDRAIRERAQKVSERKLQLDEFLTEAQLVKYDAEVDKLEVEINKGNLDIQNYWPKILAQMGPDNVLAALVMYNGGIDAEQILKLQGNTTPERRAAVDHVINTIKKLSGPTGEIVGGIELMKDLTNRAGGAILRRQLHQPKDRRKGFTQKPGDQQDWPR